MLQECISADNLQSMFGDVLLLIGLLVVFDEHVKSLKKNSLNNSYQASNVKEAILLLYSKTMFIRFIKKRMVARNTFIYFDQYFFIVINVDFIVFRYTVLSSAQNGGSLIKILKNVQ